jgi:hypothetical protein
VTLFAAFILTDAAFFGLLVASLIWLFKTSSGALWLKVALAVAFGCLVCWSPLATRAILGYPQPRSTTELPDRFQLFAEHSVDDKSFDLWIGVADEPSPLALTVVPDKEMRSVLRQAQQKLGQGQPVFITRKSSDGQPVDGKGNALNGEKGNARDGAPRTSFTDDQDRWTLDFPRLPAKADETK